MQEDTPHQGQQDHKRSLEWERELGDWTPGNPLKEDTQLRERRGEGRRKK